MGPVRSGSGPAGPKCKPKAARTYTIYTFSGMNRPEGGCPGDLFEVLPARLGWQHVAQAPWPIQVLPPKWGGVQNRDFSPSLCHKYLLAQQCCAPVVFFTVCRSDVVQECGAPGP